MKFQIGRASDLFSKGLSVSILREIRRTISRRTNSSTMEGDLKAVERRPLVRFVDSAPVNFIDNLLAKADPKFGHINGSYDPASESYVTVADATLAGTSAVSTRDSQKSFELAIRSYLETRKGARVVFDFSKHHTWEHVLAEVKATQDEYQGVAAKGIIGHMRERLRSFGDRAGVVESWLKILPSASWQGSLVCGGIKIVLQVRQCSFPPIVARTHDF